MLAAAIRTRSTLNKNQPAGVSVSIRLNDAAFVARQSPAWFQLAFLTSQTNAAGRGTADPLDASPQLRGWTPQTRPGDGLKRHPVGFNASDRGIDPRSLALTIRIREKNVGW